MESIGRIRSVLEQSDEGFLNDTRLDLANFIHRACWIHLVHPFIVLIAMQREQSLLSKDGKAATERAYSRALGVVGQHTPGTINTSWDGLPTQILMAVRTIAWLGGIGPDDSFGNYRLWPSAPRWHEDDRVHGKTIALLNSDGSFNRHHSCMDEMEYVELAYTPAQEKADDGLLAIRKTNALIFEKQILPLWGP